jgi:hypothetical protein
MIMRSRQAAVLCVLLGAGTATAEPGLPPLQDGDLVFQTSQSSQSAAILAATGHPFTHMGLIRLDPTGPVVIEAQAGVIETPLAEWIARGAGGQVAIYRDADLTPDAAETVLRAAGGLLGRPYDPFFRMGDEAIYCSELAWLAYAAAGVEIGRVERLGDLDLGDGEVQALIASRWTADPDCAADADSLEACLAILQERALVTPASIAEDARFSLVVSTY